MFDWQSVDNIDDDSKIQNGVICTIIVMIKQIYNGNSFDIFFISCNPKPVVDAVYAIAHAIDNMIKEKCKEVPFHDCEEIQPSPMGYELLRHIHNVSFVGRQNTSVSNLSKKFQVDWEMKNCSFCSFER